MKSNNLRNFDLNLLPILGALLEEKSVTAASRRVHLSQSATSSALRRLRECFDDPILVRRGQHMFASRKALLVHSELSQALESLGGILTTLRAHDKSANRLDINISAPEYVSMAMSNAVQDLLIDTTKHFNVNMEPFIRRGLIERLDDGSIDIALGAFGRLKPNIHRQVLYHEALNVVLRAGHPAIARATGGVITMEDFLGFPHLQVTAGEILEDAWVSRMLTSRSLVRQVNVVMSSVSLVPDVLSHTDLLCVGTERGLAHTPHREGSLVALKVPSEIDFDDYVIEMIWHEQTDSDPDLAWVRGTIAKLGQALDATRARDMQVATGG